MSLSYFFLLVNLVVFFAPGFLLTPTFFNFKQIKNPVATYCFYSLLLPCVFTPLLIFFSHHFFGLLITGNLIAALLVLLSAIGLVAFALQTHKGVAFIFTKIKKLSVYNFLFQLVIVIFILTSFSVHFLISHPLSGPDSPSYLYQSAKIVHDSKVSYEGFDRRVLQILPLIFTLSNVLTLETTTKLLSALLYILGGFIVYLTSYNLTENKKLSLFTLWATLFSYPLARFSWDIYAMLMAIIVIYSVLNIFLLKQNQTKPSATLLASFLIGSTFNMHGVISFSALVFLVPPLVYKIIIKIKQINLHKTVFLFWTSLSLLIFTISSQPLILNSLSYLYQGVYKPVVATQTQTIKETERPNEGLENFARVKNQVSLLDFPLNRNLFVNTYTLPWIVSSVLGIVVILRHKTISTKIKKHKKYPFLLFAFGGFLLTQQAYIGVDWYSPRFVFTLYPVVVILGSMFFWAISLQFNKLNTHPKTKNLILFATATVFLFIFGKQTINFLFFEFNSPVNINEYFFYKNLNLSITDKNAPIFYVGHEKEWLVGLNPFLNFILVDPEHICVDRKVFDISPQNWLIANAFCLDTSLKDSLITLSEFGQKEYYLLVQTENTNTDPNLFLNPHYSLIDKQDTLHLVKRIK